MIGVSLMIDTIRSFEEGIVYRLIYSKETPSPTDSFDDERYWNFSNQFGVFVIQKFLRDSKETETPLEVITV